jgi:hypothetical protein
MFKAEIYKKIQIKSHFALYAILKDMRELCVDRKVNTFMECMDTYYNTCRCETLDELKLAKSIYEKIVLGNKIINKIKKKANVDCVILYKDDVLIAKY